MAPQKLVVGRERAERRPRRGNEPPFRRIATREGGQLGGAALLLTDYQPTERTRLTLSRELAYAVASRIWIARIRCLRVGSGRREKTRRNDPNHFMSF